MEKKEELIRNLKDAGCTKEEIQEFLNCQCCCDKKKELKFLACQRKQLLEKIHEYQRKLDCLDYLIYQMKENENKNIDEK